MGCRTADTCPRIAEREGEASLCAATRDNAAGARSVDAGGPPPFQNLVAEGAIPRVLSDELLRGFPRLIGSLSHDLEGTYEVRDRLLGHLCGGSHFPRSRPGMHQSGSARLVAGRRR